MDFLFTTLIALVMNLTVSSQLIYSSELADYYIPPMGSGMILSANFAETRTNHFHSGIDIKTGGVEGRPVYAVADGYISRVGVAPSGYGRVLYMNHPNGTTSVYAHLQRFLPEIEQYLDDGRHSSKVHRTDLYPDEDRFTFRKGDLIGWSGNSGMSFGPHLHFEIRETATSRPFGVLTRGIYSVRDDIPPYIVNMFYVAVDTVSGVPVNAEPVRLPVEKVTANEYRLAHGRPVEVSRSGYFVAEVTDRKNNTANTFGVYSVTASLDEVPLFGFSLDIFSFDETRYVNSLMHYDLQRGSKNQLLRLAVQENNRLKIFDNVRNRGAVYIADTLVHNYRVEVKDDNGNVSTIAFPVVRGKEDFVGHWPEGAAKVNVRSRFEYSKEGLTLSAPAGAFYEPMFFIHDMSPRSSVNDTRIYSKVHKVHSGSVPVHSNILLSIDASELPEELRKRSFLALVSSEGRLSYGGKYSDGAVTGNIQTLGNYCIAVDTKAPEVDVRFADGADLSDAETFTVAISDDLSGVASFTATIDGKWIPFEQDVLKGTITHKFNKERIIYGGQTHALVLTVTDNAGNSTTVRRSFVK